MKINFKQPRYIIPLITLPFLCLFNYLFAGLQTSKAPLETSQDILQGKVADVSEEIIKRELADKLAVYKNQYKNGDGYTAIGEIQDTRPIEYKFDELYNDKEKRTLDSLEKELKANQVNFYYNQPQSSSLPALREEYTLNNITSFKTAPTENSVIKSEDPIALFRKQMEIADSFAKANDPEKISSNHELENLHNEKIVLRPVAIFKVEKLKTAKPWFNTILKDNQESLIKAIVDENRTAFNDSRLRLRLLEDLKVADQIIEKGTYLYAKVTGFSSQRVKLSVNTLLTKNKILQVDLQIFDQDGAQGLYVPQSAFREMSRELSSNASQGININQLSENNTQLLMSTLQRMYQSTSNALSQHIRKNKAKIKYNTLIYLVDKQDLQ